RRHTRCLSDWSSDVCSSDLEVEPQAVEQAFAVLLGHLDPDAPVVAHVAAGAAAPISASGRPNILSDLPVWSRYLVIPPSQNGQRSEERRVGKGGRTGGGR